MFAVIRTGGKQYKVTEGQTLEVEKLDGQPGDKVTIDDILMVDGKLGSPTIKGASVTAEIVAQGKGEKVLIFKKRRRHNYRRKRGHRQLLTTLKITGIKA